MSKINVFLQGEGLKKIELLQLESNSTINNVKHTCVSNGIQIHQDTAVFEEDQDSPIDGSVCIDSLSNKHGIRLQVHRCHQIGVKVTYSGQVVEKNFGPGKTIEAVKKWAAKEFGIVDEDATELILQIMSTNEQPDVDVHIGSLVTFPDCSISFDLVPNLRIQGAI